MSNYFVRHLPDTTSAPAESSINPSTNLPNEEVRQYFSGNSGTSEFSVSPNSKVFSSDGLKFRRIDGKNAVEVIGLEAAVTAVNLIIPATTANKLPVIRIAENAFFNSFRIKSIALPASIEEIADNAFAGCTFESITISPSVKKIGEEAFAGSNLTSVNMAGSTVEIIEERTFLNCPLLKKITLPECLTEIKESAFKNAFTLDQIVFPDSLKSIEMEAFANCKSLHTVTFGKGLRNIASDIFKGCASLCNIIDPCDIILDNVHIFKDSALYKNADITFEGFKMVCGTLISTTPPKLTYWKSSILPEDTHAIDSYALLNYTEPVIELPKSLKLLMPNALVQKDTIKTLENGIVHTIDGFRIKVNVKFNGSITDWLQVTKLHADTLYPVLVTCVSDDEKNKITFIDYI